MPLEVALYNYQVAKKEYQELHPKASKLQVDSFSINSFPQASLMRIKKPSTASFLLSAPVKPSVQSAG